MPGKENIASKKQVDRLLKAASPNNGFDVRGVTKLERLIEELKRKNKKN